ncbi:hypothetical protein AL08_03190 [Corynebacterium diphtheriae bv. gravis str. ISS 4746]|nr:hypothetical protein B179_03036 [Corynebacterium diphtheriae str. Aberdeen]ERA57800.1 hypothetical protein B178_03171 [Corynebacterium diphtheriae DSM 43988]KLN42410.1 hypothetical protein AL08_03190 [Corynebacterium diphtheriae bv. gravis str. ISS 4746]
MPMADPIQLLMATMMARKANIQKGSGNRLPSCSIFPRKPEGAVLWGGVVVLISGLRSSATMMSASVLTMM